MNARVALATFSLVFSGVAARASAAPYLASVYAERAPKPAANAITVAPVNLLLGEASLGYERAVGARVSLHIQPTFLFPKALIKGDVNGPGHGSIYAVGSEASARIYILGRALEGLYLEPYSSFYHLFPSRVRGSAGGDNRYAGGQQVHLGGRLGAQWLVRDKVVLALSGGGAYTYAWGRVEEPGRGERSASLAKFRPDAHLSVGVAF